MRRQTDAGAPAAPPAAAATLATLAILAVVLFWGLSFVSSKTVLNTGFPPLTMVCLRFIVASLLLLPLQKRLYPRARLPRRAWLPLAAAGLSGVTIYFFFEVSGLRRTSASSASLIIASIPVFTVLAEYLFYRAPISRRQALGILLSVAGVYVIVSRSPQGFGGLQGLAGNLLMLGACLSWVAYILISRLVPEELPRLTVTAYQSFWGAAFLLPLALLERPAWRLGTPAVWLNILYLGLFCSALGYFLYQFALKHLGAVVLSTWLNLIPVVGAGGGIALLGERLAPLQAIGGAVVIAGVLLVSWRRRRAPAADKAAGG